MNAEVVMIKRLTREIRKGKYIYIHIYILCVNGLMVVSSRTNTEMKLES